MIREQLTISILDGDDLLAENISVTLWTQPPADDALGTRRGVAIVTGLQARKLITLDRCRAVANDGRAGTVRFTRGTRNDSMQAWDMEFEFTGAVDVLELKE